MTATEVITLLLTVVGIIFQAYLFFRLFQGLIGNFSHRTFQVFLLSIALSEITMLIVAVIIILITGKRIIPHPSLLQLMFKNMNVDIWDFVTK